MNKRDYIIAQIIWGITSGLMVAFAIYVNR